MVQCKITKQIQYKWMVQCKITKQIQYKWTA